MVDDRDVGVAARGLDFVDHCDRQVLGADPAGVVELITRLIMRGLGISLLPSAFIRPRAADDPGLTLVPVVDGPRRTAYLVWNRFNPGPATRAMPGVLGVPSTAS